MWLSTPGVFFFFVSTPTFVGYAPIFQSEPLYLLRTGAFPLGLDEFHQDFFPPAPLVGLLPGKQRFTSPTFRLVVTFAWFQVPF